MSTHEQRPLKRLADIAVLVAVLVAFSWQSILVRAHFHAPAHVAPAHVASAYATGSPASALVRHDRSGDTPDESKTCDLCRELALAGVYIASSAILLALRPSIAQWHAGRAIFARSLQSRSHRWQSRAPPSSRAA